jgi:hypothetical protein
MAADGDFPARLAQMQREGRVSGLHTLLFSRGGKVLFEHYGAGDDESWGKRSGPSHSGRLCRTICVR